MPYRFEAIPHPHTEQYVVEMDFMFGDADGSATVEVSFKREDFNKFEQFLSDLALLNAIGNRLGSDLVGDFWRDTYKRTEDGKLFVRPPVMERTRNRWETDEERHAFIESLPEWRRWFDFQCDDADKDGLSKQYPDSGIAEWPNHPEYLGEGPGSLESVNLYFYDATGSKYRLIQIDEDGNDIA